MRPKPVNRAVSRCSIPVNGNDEVDAGVLVVVPPAPAGVVGAAVGAVVGAEVAVGVVLGAAVR